MFRTILCTQSSCSCVDCAFFELLVEMGSLDWAQCSFCAYFVERPYMIDFPWGFGPLCDWCGVYWVGANEPMDASHWWCDLPNEGFKARDALGGVLLPL